MVYSSAAEEEKSNAPLYLRIPIFLISSPFLSCPVQSIPSPSSLYPTALNLSTKCNKIYTAGGVRIYKNGSARGGQWDFMEPQIRAKRETYWIVGDKLAPTRKQNANNNHVVHSACRRPGSSLFEDSLWLEGGKREESRSTSEGTIIIISHLSCALCKGRIALNLIIRTFAFQDRLSRRIRWLPY